MRPDFPFQPRAFPFFYGWVIAGASTVGVLMSVPGQTMGVGVFTDHLIAATGLSRLELANAYLLGTLSSGLLLPYGGSLVDRHGTRRIVVGACAGLALTLCYLAGSDGIARFFADALHLRPGGVAWVVLALGFTCLRFSGQGMLTLVSRIMLARWFNRRRGIVAAVSGVFTNFGFAGSPLLLHMWIEAAGWRGAWLGMAAAIGLGMGTLGWLLYRDNPEECGLRMDGEDLRTADPQAVQEEERHLTRPEAVRTVAFWLITAAIANQSLVGTGIVFHIVDIGAEQGLSQAQSVAIFLPVAVTSSIVGLLAGMAVDRLPLRYLIMAMMVGQAVMFAGLGHIADLRIYAITVAGWGLASGFYMPLTVAALPAFFGRLHLGAIQGAQAMCLVVASAIGPSFLALFEAQFGSYRPGLYASCLLPAIVFAAAPFTRDPRRA